MSDAVFSVRGHIRVEGAATNPTVNDDTTRFFAEGSIWINTTTNASFVCLDAAAGVAVWTEITSQIPASLLTTRGDIIRRNATVPERLAVGASKTALISDGTDPSWGYQVANISTADKGYFLAPIGVIPAAGATAPSCASANQCNVVQFVLPFRLTVNDIQVNVTTLEAAKFFGCGVYADTTSAALFATGALSTAATGRIKTTLGAPYVLEPGAYYFAWTGDGTVARLAGVNCNSAAVETLFADTINQSGLAANAGTAGALPATLGTIATPALGLRFPLALFKT